MGIEKYKPAFNLIWWLICAIPVVLGYYEFFVRMPISAAIGDTRSNNLLKTPFIITNNSLFPKWEVRTFIAIREFWYVTSNKTQYRIRDYAITSPPPGVFKKLSHGQSATVHSGTMAGDEPGTKHVMADFVLVVEYRSFPFLKEVIQPRKQYFGFLAPFTATGDTKLNPEPFNGDTDSLPKEFKLFQGNNKFPI